MKTLDHNAIDRSLSFMAMRIPERHTARKIQDNFIRPQEVEQQFQVPITGRTGRDSFTDIDVNFSETIYYAPLQRSGNKNEDPHFSWGMQLDSGDAIFSVHVTTWNLDEEANYTGATVRIHGAEPAWFHGKIQKPYSGTLHLTFEGLAIPVEDPGYDETP